MKNNKILRTYISETEFIDEPIFDYLDKIEDNQSVINEDQLKDVYWKIRWGRMTGRPGCVFKCQLEL